MTNFLEITEEQMLRLREGLELLETLDRDAIHEIDICFYGLTNDPSVLAAAREVIASEQDDENVSEEDVELGEIAIAIPLSSDVIYYLTGSGLKLRDEYFSYPGVEGEGPRRNYLGYAHYHPTVTTHSFQHMALALSDSWVDDYLQKVGGHGAVATRIKKKVQRSEEATQPVPVIEQKTPGQLPAGQPKQTSLKVTAATNFEHVRKHLMEIGMTIYKKEGEYRVNFKNGLETTAYYTDSLQDAILTAETMAKQKSGQPKQTSVNLKRLVEDFLG